MLAAAILVIPLIIIEESSLAEPWDTIAVVMNWTIWTAFLVELAVMLSVVPNHWRWIRDNPLDVLIVLVTPPFLPSTLASARLLRLLRLVRLLKLAQLLRGVFTLTGLRWASILVVLTALGGGAAYADLEDKPDTWDDVWWAATTMTTVGYGDEYPTTGWGRVIGVLVMVVGIGFIALLTGAIAQRFLAVEVADRGARGERGRGDRGHAAARATGDQGPASRTRRYGRAGPPAALSRVPVGHLAPGR